MIIIIHQTLQSLQKKRYTTKGQMISKGLFGVLEFSQKRNEQIRRSIENKFVRSFFLGEFEDTTSPFKII